MSSKTQHNGAHLLHEGPDFVILSKPGGMTTFGFVDSTGHMFQNSAREVFGPATRPFAVHHLDMDTTGCLIVSSSSRARGRLAKAFAERQVKKEYLAIVVGQPEQDSGTINTPLFVQGAIGTHPTTTVDPAGKRAETHFNVLATDGILSLLSLKPVTGVTHQLRVHCASVLKTPILGDPWYNPYPNHSEPPMFLHAFKIGLPGEAPANGVLRVSAPLPPYMAEKVTAMGAFSTLGYGTA